MKRDIAIVFSVFFTVGIVFSIPAYADHSTATVSIPQGTSVPGCETNNECFVPYDVTIDVGGEVTWSNDDSAAHTVTGGSAADGPSGIFDSSLFMAGTTFTFKFEETGTYDYFCMVHPWMEGIVTVQEAGAEEETGEHEEETGEHEEETGEHEEETGEHEETTTLIKGMSEDGSVNIDIMTTDPIQGEEMTIKLEFLNSSGDEQKHMNYDIVATQNGNQVLNESDVHLMEANSKHTTKELSSDDPVDVTITLQGIGMNEPYTGPKGEVVQFKVVPEFGTIAMIILGISITSIIALSTKSIIPRF